MAYLLATVTGILVILCSAGPTLVGSAGCREFTLLCNTSLPLDNCNITRYRQYIAAATSAVLVNAQMRMPKASLKEQWINASGSCYIEAVVGSKGQLLFIRFGSSRSLFTGRASTTGWESFRHAMARYEAFPDGMQLVMDINGQAICPQLRSPQRNRGNFISRILARFSRRAVISHVPMDAYVDGQFDLANFDSESSQLRLMQKPIGPASGPAIDIYDQLKVNQKHPLTLWIYKCPTRLGIKKLPCNSEVNLYIFLRQWVNTTALFVQEDDFFTNADWRPKVIMQDMALLALVSITSIYILIHITCLTWIGLANASSEDDF